MIHALISTAATPDGPASPWPSWVVVAVGAAVILLAVRWVRRRSGGTR